MVQTKGFVRITGDIDFTADVDEEEQLPFNQNHKNHINHRNHRSDKKILLESTC